MEDMAFHICPEKFEEIKSILKKENKFLNLF